ncbi:TolB-like translocation protein [Sporosarcina obsidiansis]|uniref:hypothetical protein n=1 Tax=Sporosarcina obsidiansis TaxID=2660748 RepID=UPI00129B6E50|nr:hypothetical protein [Sporosarcina obsidiansis]
MKKSLVFIIGFLVFLTAVFIVLGLLFDKEENEKQAGLTDIYDVSSEGSIAYVVYEKGQANLYLDGQKQSIVQLSVEKSIVDVEFSKDDKYLAFAVSDKDLEKNNNTDIHIIQLDSLEDQLVYSIDALITELAFDPKDSERLFYLQAGTFTNYSPIAAKYPHGFDVYSYHLGEQTHTQHTDLKKYSMASLQVSSDDELVYVQMDDDEGTQSAEEAFSTNQRIFEIPLDDPNEKSVVSSSEKAEDIFDFIVLPERQEFIYQAVAGTGENGIYEYELFTFNWKTNKTEQLTTLKESVSKPVRGSDDKIYFMVDREFGSRTPDYHLFRIDVAGKKLEEIPLDY